MTSSNLQMNYYDGWVYYVESSRSYIYKVRLDGTQRMKISSKIVCSAYFTFCTAGDWIVYMSDGDKKLYKIRTDGTDEQLLVPKSEMAKIQK